MLNIIGGLDSYASGDLIIDGISTKEYRSRDWDTFRNNRIGFVFQSYNLISHQSVLSNVELALTLSGVGRDERRQRALAVIERVGLTEHANKLPNQLSGGQMQRVAIARALVNDPEILLADEPTGALDSQTSLEVMDLLSEIANDRLVIMVTHNPELAQRYANRIVTLRDGQIKEDTNAFIPNESDLNNVSNKEIRKTSMSFLTALTLSFNNLMTKKGRTFMTAFAGSVGIIGIAAILALSNGVNNYIRSFEESTTASYPLQINKSGMDLSSLMMTGETTSDTSESDTSADSATEGTVGQKKVITNMVNTMTNNDLVSFKKYIESDDGKTIRESAATVKYSYSISPHIYIKDSFTSEYRKVNPDTTLTAFGLGNSSISNSSLSSMMSSNVFVELVDKSLYEDYYDVKAGKWPQNSDECVLVLSEDGQVSDYTLYTLGLRDYRELEDIVKSVSEEKEITVPEDDKTYSYGDFMNLDLKMVISADYYSKDSTYGIWVDKSDDKSHINSLLDNKSKNLKICGIVQQKKDAKITPLTTSSIYYTQALTHEVIEEASSREIVKEQLNNKNVDVISGKNFSDLNSSSSSSLDMSKLFTVDTGAISAAFSFDSSSLNLNMANLSTDFSLDNVQDLPAMNQEALAAAIGQASPTIKNDQFFAMIAEIMNDFTAKRDEIISRAGGATDMNTLIAIYMTYPSAQNIMANYGPKIFDTTQMTSQIYSGLQSYMQSYMASAMQAISASVSAHLSDMMASIQSQIVSNMASSIKIDESVIQNAFKVNMTSEELQSAIMSMMSGSNTSSYDNNLSKLNYADLSSPTAINIYAKNFDSKQSIIDEIDKYNNNVSQGGDTSKKVVYTDIVGTMMSGLRTIINIITYMLIAFVSISLVVSSIMIGIITYVSVLERTKEIGILRAIGASRNNISQVFNAETVIEGAIAGIIGVAVTALLCFPANAIISFLAKVDDIASLPLGAAVVLILVSILLTFIAGLIPATSASKKDPVVALRSE